MAQSDTTEIVRLYVDEKQSVRQIANRLGSSYGRVYGILRARAVLRRRNTEHLTAAEVLRERIITGEWPPGRRIPAQRELAEGLDARQQTIREAIAHLRARGYLVTLPHRGTFVRQSRDWEHPPRIGARAARTLPAEL